MTPADSASQRAYLDTLAMHGIKLGLDNIQALLAAADHPQASYPTVHVAGTNGKGSTLALLQAMLCAAGYRTGRFTSPHLLDVTERFQIDGVSIPESALAENIAFFREAAQALPHPPTFFELNTAVAFRYFAQQQVDIALIETGMGGRLDSTNVLTPVVTAVTNIDLEHTAYLGDTLAAIAGEKAGIFKPGVPAVTAETQPEALDVIRHRAALLHCPLEELGRDFSFTLHGPPWDQRITYNSAGLSLHEAPLGLAGRYQGANAAVALALAERLAPRFPRLDNAALLQGLATAHWPGRLERVLDDPPVIIDVAHNVAGARQLTGIFNTAVIIMAVAADKDAAGMIALLAPMAEPLILTTFHGTRALSVDALSAAAAHHPHRTAPSLREAIAMAWPLATAARPLLITGSIFAAGEARQILMDEYGAPPLQF
jgi:dihydrofolate synthase/folylpolyglutamate synthase